MADFDDLIKSQLESFKDPIGPSKAEIDQMNIGLDGLSGTSWIRRRWWLVLLVLLLLLSQGWLIYSNWSLRREFVELNRQVTVKEHNTDYEARVDRISNMGNDKPRQLSKFSVPLEEKLDTQSLVVAFLKRNSHNDDSILISTLQKELEKFKLELIEKFSVNPSQGIDQSTLNKEDDQVDKALVEIGLPKQSNSILLDKKGPSKDTVVLETIAVIDTALFDSLFAQRVKQNDPLNLNPETIRTPLSVTWKTAIGIKPGYSNLYLLDGRFVFDAHAVAGIELNNKYAINAGVKYRAISVYEDLYDGPESSVLENFDNIPSETIETADEFEGSSYGWYATFDGQYFFSLSNFNPFLRVGTDINLFSQESYKVEYGNDLDYRINQQSRKVQLSDVFLGLGANTTLNDNFSIDWEGGAIIGRSMTPVLINDKNGIYAQIRLLYIISH